MTTLLLNIEKKPIVILAIYLAFIEYMSMLMLLLRKYASYANKRFVRLLNSPV